MKVPPTPTEVETLAAEYQRLEKEIAAIDKKAAEEKLPKVTRLNELWDLLVARARKFGSQHEKKSKLLYGLTLIVMGLPSYGAKVGAIPSAVCGYGATLLVWQRSSGRLRLRELALVLGATALLLSGLFLLDLRHSADQSHLARAFTGGAGDSLLLVARRKLMLEGQLLLHSSWNGPLWAGALVFLWLQRRSRRREDRAVVAGITVGAIASLL